MARGFVILAVLAALPQFSAAQYSAIHHDDQKRDLGPRAIALLELSPDGTAKLVPVAIMINGDFFDASAYKADPVPMSLDSGTVYEGMQTGVSQGLFTIREAVQTGSAWSARGKWQDSAALAAAAAAKKRRDEEEKQPPTLADDDKGPPKLLRRSSGNADDKTTPSANKPASAGNQPPPDTDSDPDRPQLKRPQQNPSANAPSPSTSSTQTPSSSSSSSSSGAKPDQAPATANQTTPDAAEVAGEEDPNRPHLERGKPAAHADTATPSTSNGKASATSSPSAAKPATSTMVAKLVPASNIQEIPAISDAKGPEPRSYGFPLKPGEDQQFRKKMLAQATRVIRAQMKLDAQEDNTHHTTRTVSHTSRSKSATPAEIPFQDVELRIFDLSSSNEPLLVLEASALVPGQTEPQHITLVCHQDINGDLHNALANVTDSHHLDVTAQMDLIDVVDADGDGRGELLFRETSDQGHAYSIYRVIGDQLYQLYESTPQ